MKRSVQGELVPGKSLLLMCSINLRNTCQNARILTGLSNKLIVFLHGYPTFKHVTRSKKNESGPVALWPWCLFCKEWIAYRKVSDLFWHIWIKNHSRAYDRAVCAEKTNGVLSTPGKEVADCSITITNKTRLSTKWLFKQKIKCLNCHFQCLTSKTDKNTR